MKLSIFVVTVALSLPASGLASPPTSKDVRNLVEVVQNQNQLASARQNDVSQAFDKLYRMPDVQAALKAIPELTVRIDDGEQKQLRSETQIAYMRSVQGYHEQRIDGIESSSKIQVDILFGLKAGLERALSYVDDRKKDKERLWDASIGFLFAAALAGIGWILARILSFNRGTGASPTED